MQNKDQILEKETNNREREREHLNKKDLFHKLSKLSSKQIKDIGLTNKDIDYLKNKILNDKLGLVLNYEEHDEFFENHYFCLEEVKELHINPKDKNNHLLIEGDNYYALKALLASGIKVDVIYIDPPYNTDNKDFVYNDSFVEKDDQFKHSKWLSFMKNRLELARELLADDGVIFVSIDDNEQAYLKVLMDEIFGEENFIVCYPRITKKGGKSTNLVMLNHDSILFYGKNIVKTKINKIKINDKVKTKYKYSDEYFDTRGKYSLSQTLDYNSLQYSKNMDYKIVFENKNFYPGGEENYNKRMNGDFKSIDWVWRWSKEMVQFGIKNDWIVAKNNRLYTKTYFNASIKKNENGYFIEYFDGKEKSMSSINFLDNKYSNDNSKKELAKIIKNSEFNYSKPSTLIKDVINLNMNKNSIILDFFAGSGTTAQAVMELNEEDGGNRRFILCTNNENNIATDICRERIYRVINGKGSKNEIIVWKYSDNKKSLNNNSMKYLRVKPIHKINGDYEDINDMEPIYVDEFNKDYISIKDFK